MTAIKNEDMGQKVNVQDDWTMSPQIARIYYGDIARKQRQIRSKHGQAFLVFGQRFSKRAGFRTFSIFDAR